MHPFFTFWKYQRMFSGGVEKGCIENEWVKKIWKYGIGFPLLDTEEVSHEEPQNNINTTGGPVIQQSLL